VADAGTQDADPASDVIDAEIVDPADTGFGSGAEPAAPGSPAPAGGPAAGPGARPTGGGPAGATPPPTGFSVADVIGDPVADADVEAAAEQVEVDLDLLLQERERFLTESTQYLDAYRRTQADFENFRRQSQKRQDDAVVRSLGGFVEGLLPVLDACDAAVAHGQADAVEPILSALYRALEKEGLVRIDPAGEPFDPEEAEAVMHEPGSGGQQVVAQVMRAGYRWRGRVLRPAMVKVTD
jgi:molecular chaperone GrpE